MTITKQIETDKAALLAAISELADATFAFKVATKPMFCSAGSPAEVCARIAAQEDGIRKTKAELDEAQARFDAAEMRYLTTLEAAAKTVGCCHD